MTTGILSTQQGKYKSRKDWSTNSIPTLVSLEEEESSQNEDGKDGDVGEPQPQKTPRRSSLAINLLGGSGSGRNNNNIERLNKRRSSIAVAFLGRHNKNKDSPYEAAVISEKCDSRNNNHNNNNNNDDNDYTNNCNNNNHKNSSGSTVWYDPSNDYNNDQVDDDNLNSSSRNVGMLSDKDKRRRASLQAKVERRRRKNFINSSMDDTNYDIGIPPMSPPLPTNGNGSGPLPTHYNRQKRHSWWNIFVPENIKQRSRRASTQDVGIGVDVLSGSSDNIAPRQFRSKSRSVDHGLAAPFDLESLRSKVEGRFDSVERLSKDGRQKGSMPTIPTRSITVGNRDTLTSVAARFDTTPSELTSINRLNSSFIYPGQQLLVPDKSAMKDGEDSGGGGVDGTSNSGKSSPVDGKLRKSSNDDVTLEEKELLDGLRPGSPKPGHIERITSPFSANDDDPVTTQRFLKINVRHITDGQGVVAGVLLVTPNAVMFDPNVSDPLVIEHGPESYGVIAPMEVVVNAAIFQDIAHMRVGGESNTTEKVEIYYPKAVCRCEQSPGKDSLLVKDETFSELVAGPNAECGDDQESVCSSNGRDGDAFPKAFDRDLVTPTNLQKSHAASTESQDGIEKPNNLITINSSTPISASTTTITTDTTDNNNILATTDADTKDTEITKKDEEDDYKNDMCRELRTLEERRRSLLDHHWAVPKKESRSIEDDSSENISTTTTTTIADNVSTVNSNDSDVNNSSTINNTNTNNNNINNNNNNNNVANDDDNQLMKLSCHDSGIDIRDPNLSNVQPIPTKKNYSDADIVLSSEWVPPLTIAPTDYTDSPPKNQHGNLLSAAQAQAQAHNIETGGRKKTSSVSFSIEDNSDQMSIDKQIPAIEPNKKQNKMLKRLSYPLTWVEGLTGDGKPTNDMSGSSSGGHGGIGSGDSAPNTGDSNQSVFSKVFSSSPITLVSEIGGNLFLSKTPSEDSGGSPVPPLTPFDGHGMNSSGRSSIGTFIRPSSSSDASSSSVTKSNKAPPPPKLDYRSMVSIDDMPELFVSFDKLIPRPARACNDPPLYLRLRMGRPIGKIMPLPTSVMSYGKNKLRPEFWFSIPKNRTDELYRFINSWVPHLYGELDEEQIKERGFELIQHDTEWVKGTANKDGRLNSEGEDITEYTRESWEVLSMSTDEYHKASVFNASFDQDLVIPDLIGTTEILTEEHREKLCGHLPARAEGYSWSLVFSTLQHGFSLNTLYRKMQRLESPILLVIEDTDNCVFGALTSCSLRVSDHFYGTGESLLYKFNPNFKVFHWTGENLYFIKGNPESLSIGAGDGKFGLWLDGDLNQGRSQRCSTYANDALAHQEDFVVKTLECWAFV